MSETRQTTFDELETNELIADGGVDSELPADVRAELDSDTKTFSESRLFKLLRDLHYAGPLARGSSPRRGNGMTTGKSGSDLRRSRDGALWNLQESREDILLNTAEDLGLIASHRGRYYTTERGASVLRTLDRCGECGSVRVPHHHEETVQISRYNTATNHKLTTKCAMCDGRAEWDRDAFPPTLTGTDDAERLARSVEGVDLWGVGGGEWTAPERRALNDFVNVLKDEHYDDFLANRASGYRPRSLGADGKKALRKVFSDYSADVCERFAELLLTTYYGACLSDVERGVIAHVAAGFPSCETRENPAAEHMEPVAVVEGDHWTATLRMEATGEYVEISGTAERTDDKLQTDTGMFSISAYNSGRGAVSAFPTPEELNASGTGDLATLVALEVDDKSYTDKSRVEQAYKAVLGRADPDNPSAARHIAERFQSAVTGSSVRSGYGKTIYDLNMTEQVELARCVRQWLNANDLSVPPLVERLAGRELR